MKGNAYRKVYKGSGTVKQQRQRQIAASRPDGVSARPATAAPPTNRRTPTAAYVWFWQRQCRHILFVGCMCPHDRKQRSCRHCPALHHSSPHRKRRPHITAVNRLHSSTSQNTAAGTHIGSLPIIHVITVVRIIQRSLLERPEQTQ
jgi:hypothetical protein